MLLTEYQKYESINGLKRFAKVSLLLFCVVFIQQSYARSHQGSIEQPVGILGMIEWLFRHPECLVGMHFDYPVTPLRAQPPK